MRHPAKNWLWLGLSLAVCAISWIYMHRVLMPWADYMEATHGHQARPLGDLYSRWVGTRELLLHGKNPYSVEVSHEIQIGFYGRPIEQTYNKPVKEIIDEQRFAYPVYVTFLMAPTMHMEFGTLNAWAPAILAVFTALTVWLSLDILRWRPAPVLTVALILFVLSSTQIAQGLRLRQLGLLVGLFFAAAVWCAVRGRLFEAGALLALSTIKPQMVILPVVFFLLWCLGDWQKRWRLAAGFGGTLGALVGVGLLLVPAWPRDFLLGLAAYNKYFPRTSIVRFVLGDLLGWLITIVALFLILVLAWRQRKAAADSPEFLSVLSLFLLVSILFLPLMIPFNQILLLLPFLGLLRDWKTISRFGRGVMIALLAWPSVVSLFFLFHPPNLNSEVGFPLLPAALSLIFPLALLLLRFTNRATSGERTLARV